MSIYAGTYGDDGILIGDETEPDYDADDDEREWDADV